VVAGPPGEARTLVDQTRADPEPPRRRLDEQQAQPGDAVALEVPYQEHRAHVLGTVRAVAFGDPAALALRLVVLDVVGHDARHERFEALVPPVLIGVERAVARDHPAEVPCARRAEHVRGHVRAVVGHARLLSMPDPPPLSAAPSRSFSSRPISRKQRIDNAA
jgi:hypothetical protein